MKPTQEVPQGITYRTINKVYCKCLDIGCPDFKRAEENRHLVSIGFSPEVERWWKWMERSRDALKHRNRMHRRIHIGQIPVVSKEDLVEYILWEQSKEET